MKRTISVARAVVSWHRGSFRGQKQGYELLLLLLLLLLCLFVCLHELHFDIKIQQNIITCKCFDTSHQCLRHLFYNWPNGTNHEPGADILTDSSSLFLFWGLHSHSGIACVLVLTGFYLYMTSLRCAYDWPHVHLIGK